MPDLSTSRGRLQASLYSMVVEHNAINLLRQNFHSIDGRAYRSSQPTPGQIAERTREYGLKTIVCLRGFHGDSPLKALEEEACEKAGVTLHYFKIFSRDVPKKETILAAKKLLESIEYPAMFHCKSGADRVGVFSTFYRHFIQKIPIEEADMLKFWPYGHIKGADTGILDHFIATYAERSAQSPIGFLEWVEQEMDREAIKKSFQPDPFWQLLVNKILNRE